MIMPRPAACSENARGGPIDASYISKCPSRTCMLACSHRLSVSNKTASPAWKHCSRGCQCGQRHSLSQKRCACKQIHSPTSGAPVHANQKTNLAQHVCVLFCCKVQSQSNDSASQSNDHEQKGPQRTRTAHLTWSSLAMSPGMRMALRPASSTTCLVSCVHARQCTALFPLLLG